MIQRPVVVRNPLGLHARPAAQFVELARSFDAEVTVHREGGSANGKSLISVLKLAVKRDNEIVIEVSGADEEAAADALAELLTSGDGAEGA
jgi:phosphotransferase system HPr (HPr) family protein